MAKPKDQTVTKTIAVGVSEEFAENLDEAVAVGIGPAARCTVSLTDLGRAALSLVANAFGVATPEGDDNRKVVLIRAALQKAIAEKAAREAEADGS